MYGTSSLQASDEQRKNWALTSTKWKQAISLLGVKNHAKQQKFFISDAYCLAAGNFFFWLQTGPFWRFCPRPWCKKKHQCAFFDTWKFSPCLSTAGAQVSLFPLLLFLSGNGDLSLKWLSFPGTFQFSNEKLAAHCIIIIHFNESWNFTLDRLPISWFRLIFAWME